ncbi:MAG: hypothetical protein ACE5FF_15740 [Saprospiraceae bacterium]
MATDGCRDKLMQCGLYPLSPLILLAIFGKLLLPSLLHPRPHLLEPQFSPWWFFLMGSGFLLFWFILSLGICLHTHAPDRLHRLRKTARTLFTPADRLLPAHPFSGTLLGFADDGTSLTLSPAQTRSHALVVGSTQTGKSTFTALWTQQQTDRSLLIIDPHASLVQRLLADGLLSQYPPDAIFPLIPKADFVPGFNLLQPLPGENPTDCARRLTNVATDVYFQGDVTAASRFRDVLFHTAWTLSATGYTVAEINAFLRSRAFRAHLTRRVAHIPVLYQWLTDAAAMSDARWRERTASTTNRFGIFETGEPALIFGQPSSTLSLHAFLRRRGLWLAPLTVDALGQDGAYLVAALLLAMTDALLARRKKGGAHPPLLIVADEFQRYPTAALERLLSERAGFGASLLLVTQGLYGLSPQLTGTVLNNCRTLTAFRLSAQQAELLTPHLFHISPLLTRQQRVTGNHDLYNYADALPQFRQKLQTLPDRHFFLRHGISPAKQAHTPHLPVSPATLSVPQPLTEILRRRGKPRSTVMANLTRRRQRLLTGTFDTPAEGGDDWH